MRYSEAFLSTTFKAIVLLVLTAMPSFAAVSLIDATTRNGSFEDGVIAPWLSGGVARDPSFATDGSWYGVFQDANVGTAREIAFQFLPANKNAGLTFNTAFDARTSPTGAFDALSVQFFGRNQDGSIVNTIEPPLDFAGLSGSGWNTFQTQFHLPNTWDGLGDVSLQILFHKSGALSGVTYVGYLDNVQLQQGPEPSTAIELISAGALLSGWRLWRYVRRMPS